jgi:hypothetical protein
MTLVHSTDLVQFFMLIQWLWNDTYMVIPITLDTTQSSHISNVGLTILSFIVYFLSK